MRVESADRAYSTRGGITFRTLRVCLDDGTLVGSVPVKRDSERERIELESLLAAVAGEVRGQIDFCPRCFCAGCVGMG